MPKKKKEEKKEGVEKGSLSARKKKISKFEIEEALIDNFISLQKVLTNIAVKFEDLTNNISKLLKLFEISASSFAEKGPGKQGDIDQDFLKKLDSLLDQNKVISKGIMLMEERIRNKRDHAPPPGSERYRTFRSPNAQGYQ